MPWEKLLACWIMQLCKDCSGALSAPTELVETKRFDGHRPPMDFGHSGRVGRDRRARRERPRGLSQASSAGAEGIFMEAWK